MGYLIAQMLLCLLAAALLGFLLGWWLRGARCRKSLDDLEASWRGRLDDCQAELKSARESVADGDEVETLRADFDRVRSELEVAEGRVERRSSEIEDLKSQLAAIVPAAGSVAVGDPDDLTKIEGIGPKISSLLHAAGYSTFAAVAEATVEALQGVLNDAGDRFQMHDPTTWPQQAQLAAEGRWNELEQFQDLLEGGKID